MHSLAWTREVFRAELGKELEEVFDDFQLSPMASGSIGQVHLAKLKAAHGTMPAGLKVAVKVQHPNLAERLGIDMAILMGFAGALGSVKGLQVHHAALRSSSPTLYPVAEPVGPVWA